MTVSQVPTEIVASQLLPGDRFQFDGREWIGDRIAVTNAEPVKVQARPLRDGAPAGTSIELTIGAEQLLRLRSHGAAPRDMRRVDGQDDLL